MTTWQTIQGHSDHFRWTGSTDQLYSARRLQLLDGPGAGLRLVEVCTAAGLRAVFCEDRALDLYELHFQGANIGFLTKNGLAGANRSWTAPGEFAKTWPAGFLATCGLRNTGPDCTVDGEFHPLHGRIGQTPAEHISLTFDEADCRLTIGCQVRESALFGAHLVLKRRIEIDLLGSMIRYADTVSNRATEAETVFLLYHINFGYPFLGPELQLQFPESRPWPRTAAAVAGLGEYRTMTAPIDSRPEQVFFHVPPAVTIDLDQALNRTGYPPADSAADWAEVVLTQPRLGITARLQYRWSELPVLTEWKSMKSGDYALGIEPGTGLIRGRAAELAHGYDLILPGLAELTFGWSIRLQNDRA